MRKPIEIRITRINRGARKGTPALFKITAVYGLMDTSELPYVCTIDKARHHIHGFWGNANPPIPVIID